MREALLRPPFLATTYPPHVTIVHPRTSDRGRECWESGPYRPDESVFTVAEVAVTAFDGARRIALATCALAGTRQGSQDELPRPPDSA